MQITRSVYLVSGSSYDRLGNVYAIRGEKSVALVDCGDTDAAGEIESSLRRFGMGEMPVACVFLTHGHTDHAGTAAYFRKKGARIFVHEADAHLLREGGLTAERTPYGEGFTFPVCEPDVLLRGGETLEFEGFQIRVWSLPGHTDGSVFYEMEDLREREGDAPGRTILFPGDTFSFDREAEEHVILCWKGSPDYDPEKLRRTFDFACQKFFPHVILSGHGMPLLTNGNAVIRAAARLFLRTYR